MSLESDDHELGVDGNLCVLGIVATVSSQLSQKDIQLAIPLAISDGL
jgi:hypothetical protein